MDSQGRAIPVQDRRTFTIHHANSQFWRVDADLTLTAREDITIQQAKHSLFALRVLPELPLLYGGVLANFEGGGGAEGTYGKAARRCKLWGLALSLSA